MTCVTLGLSGLKMSGWSAKTTSSMKNCLTVRRGIFCIFIFLPLIRSKPMCLKWGGKWKPSHIVNFLRKMCTSKRSYLLMSTKPLQPPLLKKCLVIWSGFFFFYIYLFVCGLSSCGIQRLVVVAPGLSRFVACGILAPWSRIEPVSCTLQGRFLTTGPPRLLVIWS